MEDLEVPAIKTSPSPPVLWKRYGHDAHTIIKKQNKNSFLEHLNPTNPSIKLSITDGTMAFLGILITPKEDGTLQTSVLRRPSYTDLYLELGQPTHNSIKVKCSGHTVP